METTIQLSADDLAWTSRKLNAQYAIVKKSEEFTDEERQAEINILAKRALTFGLKELVDRFGFHLYEIELTHGKAQLMIPKKATIEDLQLIRNRIASHFNIDLKEIASD